MKAVLVNYCFDPVWLKDFPDLEVTIYDRSDDGEERNLTQYGNVIKTPNFGDVDFDKLTWLIENYDTLPDSFLWGKTNLPKYVELSDVRSAIDAGTFAPLLKMDHRIYGDRFGPVCYYQGGMYFERADSWFFNAPGVDRYHFNNWDEWCQFMMLPKKGYIPFPPGGNFILTKERVQRYSRDYYEKMRSVLHSQRPAEAQCCERTYMTLWQ